MIAHYRLTCGSGKQLRMIGRIGSRNQARQSALGRSQLFGHDRVLRRERLLKFECPGHEPTSPNRNSRFFARQAGRSPLSSAIF